MINLDNSINIFYKDNPHLFFIKENNYYSAPATLPPNTHPALDIDEEEYQDFLSQLQGTDYNDTRADIPKLKDDKNRALKKDEIERVPTIGKATSAIKKLALTLAIPVTIGMFAYAWVHDKSSDSDVPPPPAVVQQIKAESPENSEIVGKVMSYNYDTTTPTHQSLDNIVKSEGFSPIPYPDKKQWSVGNGTVVSKTHTGKKISSSTWETLEEEFKGYNFSQKKRWLRKNYPNWKKDFYNLYKITPKQQSKDNVDEISKENARIAASVHLNNLVSEMENIAKYDFSKVSGEKKDIVKYWQFLPKNVKEAYLDLAYNMGKGFLKKFKNFHKAIALAGDILSQKQLTEEDITYANILFKEAADQLLYNYDDEGKSRGETKYHSDLKSSKRPQGNADKIRKGIKDKDEYFSTVNFQNESLKKVYMHLFV